MNDQAFWGRRVFELGVGPKPSLRASSRLKRWGARSTGLLLTAGYAGAEELGEMIRAERGVLRAVEIIDERMGRSKPA